MIKIALYQPDIAQNTGTIARFCACFGLPLTIIEPAGFAWTDSSFRRAGMDYLDHVEIHRMPTWDKFLEATPANRLVLLTTKAEQSYLDMRFEPGDVLLLGRESAGVPGHIHDAMSRKVTIPMKPPARSLNVALATAIVASEALRQIETGK